MTEKPRQCPDCRSFLRREHDAEETAGRRDIVGLWYCPRCRRLAYTQVIEIKPRRLW